MLRWSQGVTGRKSIFTGLHGMHLGHLFIVITLPQDKVM